MRPQGAGEGWGRGATGCGTHTPIPTFPRERGKGPRLRQGRESLAITLDTDLCPLEMLHSVRRTSCAHPGESARRRLPRGASGAIRPRLDTIVSCTESTPHQFIPPRGLTT